MRGLAQRIAEWARRLDYQGLTGHPAIDEQRADDQRLAEGPVNTEITIHTPDVEAFRRSQGQIGDLVRKRP